MAKGMGKNVVGGWAFLIGVVLAVILGAFGILNGGWILLLVLIGLIIGLLNIADQETMPFLLSGLALIIASALGQDVMSQVDVLNNVLNALLAVFVPATVIVAIRNVFSLARR